MHRPIVSCICAALLSVALASFAAAAAPASDPAGATALRDFIDAASYRLVLADQVALTKWDSGKAVEDPQREKIVIEAAVSKAGAQAASGQRVAAVFSDQIEANKLVQYRLLAQWQRAGGAPDTARPDLVRDIRPALDLLQIRLIDGLLHTGALAAQRDCAREVAVAVGDYVRVKQLDPLHALALDRATARLCQQ